MKNLIVSRKQSFFRTLVLAMGMLFTTGVTLAQVAGNGVVSSVTYVTGCVSFTAAQGNGPDNWEVAEGGTYNVTLTGVTECSGSDITVFVQSSFSGNFCFNATGGNGTYSGTVTIPSPSCFTMPISYKCGANQSCDNSNTYAADGPTGNGKVHFRTSNFDGDCNRTGSDEDCGTCEANIGINVGGNTSICAGSCVTLTATGGVTYEWSTGETGPSIEVCEEGDYSVAGIDGNGCTGSSTSIHITVNTPPTVSIDASGGLSACSPACVQLTATGATSYVWSNGATDATISACENGEFSVVGTDDNGCSDASDAVTVTIHTPPVVSIDASNGLTACAPSCVLLTATGATSYVWSPNGETDASISACSGGEYSVIGTDDNGCSDASEPVSVVIHTPPTVEIGLSTPDPICDGECVTLTASGADSYLWSNEETTASISACEDGDYTVVGTDANGCTSEEATVHVTVYPRPSCDIIEPTIFPVYGLGNNPLSATVDCPEGCNCSYEWSVTSSDGSWAIQTTNGLSITYYCGNNGTTGHFTLTVTCDETGCSSTCNLDVTSQAQEHCAYTQGFYGNNNGQNGGYATCVGLRVDQAINQALNYPSCNPIVVGYGSKTLTVPCDAASIQCLMTKMPGGGTSAALPNSSNVNVCNATGNSWVGNTGKFKNTLLGQTLALSINLRLFPNLANVKITTTSFTTYEATACQNGNAIPGTGQTFTIPQSIINCLGTVNNKVSDLLVLANKRLGAQTTCGSIAYADVTAALDAVNRGFDKCRINSTANIRYANSATADESGFDLVAYPNPTSGMTTIEFVATTGTHASVKIFGLDGSLKANLLDDEVPLGATAKVHFDASSWASGIYFVNLVVGDKAAFQKIVIMN